MLVESQCGDGRMGNESRLIKHTSLRRGKFYTSLKQSIKAMGQNTDVKKLFSFFALNLRQSDCDAADVALREDKT